MRKIKIVLILGALLCCFLVGWEEVWAQCPMCKAAAESNLKEGGKHGAGLNAGILYLFITPYLIVMTVGLLWWWNNRKANQEEALQERMGVE